MESSRLIVLVLTVKLYESHSYTYQVLAQQAKRKEFNFGQYGEEMLEELDQIVNYDIDNPEKNQLVEANSIKFSSFCPPNTPRYEVCRRFLTTLVLCNVGNV